MCLATMAEKSGDTLCRGFPGGMAIANVGTSWGHPSSLHTEGTWQYSKQAGVFWVIYPGSAMTSYLEPKWYRPGVCGGALHFHQHGATAGATMSAD